MQITRNITPEFTDERGTITKLLDDGKTNIKSVLLIHSKKDTVRANHYHKADGHYVYMLAGKMEYFEAPVIHGEPNRQAMEKAELRQGDMVFSGPMIAHAMRFLEDSVWVVLALKSRSQQDYEQDTVRVKLI